MSLDQLANTLRQAINPGGDLALTGALVGSNEVGALIRQLYPDGTLKLAKAQVTFQPGDTSIGVAGRTDLVAVKQAPVEIAFSLDKGEQIAILVHVRPADGWTMDQLFAVLPDQLLRDLQIESAALVLATAPFTDPGTGATMPVGLSFSGKLKIDANLAYLAAILGAGKKLAIAGPIGDFELPLFDWRTEALGGTLGPVPLDAIRLRFASVNMADPGPVQIALAVTALEAQITVDRVKGVISASLPADASSIVLNADFEKLDLTGFAALGDFIGATDPFAALPPPVVQAISDVGGAFTLAHLGLTFDIANRRFVWVEMGVRINLRGFKIFSAIPALALDEIDLMLKVNTAVSPKQVFFGARADIRIGDDCHVFLEFQTQPNDGYQISVTRQPGPALQLTKVLQPLMPGLEGFPDFDVATFSLILLPQSGQHSLDVVILSNWEILASPAITLAEIDIQANYAKSMTPTCYGLIRGVFTLAVDNDRDNDILITLAAEKPQGRPGWLLLGQTGEDQPIPVGNLFTAVGEKFKADAPVPRFLADLTVENLDLQFDTEEKSFHFGSTIRMPFENDVTLDIVVMLNVEPIETGYEVRLAGTFFIKAYRFDIVFDHKARQSDTLVATYSVVDGAYPSISLKELLDGISPELGKDVPIDITIELKDVKFVFYRDTANKLAFGLDVGIGIDLSNIPIVGSKLPEGFSLAVSNLQAVYASKAFSKAQIEPINALLPETVEPFSPEGLVTGSNVAADLVIGTQKKSFVLAGVKPKQVSGPDAIGADAAPAGDNFKWLTINKQIGIFQFNRAGAGYADNVLSLAIDAGVSLGPLSFTMDGLSVSSPLNAFDPVFSLRGLGLAFSRPPLSIMGNFLKVDEPAGKSYYGQVSVQAAQIGFSAIGGWSPDANPASFFLYASLDIPLGGPPFLFVTGLAAGFGINRTLLLPTIEELPDYILLPGKAPAASGSPSETVSKILPQLQKVFQDKPGQYWVAAGLKFTSFEMVDAFVLVTVSFGVDFQLGILGSAAMTFPRGTENPVAFLEVDLIATFTPGVGVLAIDGRISPQSYIFGGFVKLSGGFAFYIWFKDDSTRKILAGDFVVTVGGYYPAYDMKEHEHYPKVPRLKIAFALGPLNVTGSSYFALCPSMLMAGVAMNAVFEAGPIRAWFDAGLNFLIAWAPFQYKIQVYVSFGVSADLGLFTISVHVGADLFIQGPAFGGRAVIDLSVITFTIEFGAEPLPPPPIGWDTFKRDFLPKGSTGEAPAPVMLSARVTAPQQPPEDSNIVKAQIRDGLLASNSGGFDWILNPVHFEILVLSAVPATAADWLTGNGPFEIHNSVADFKVARPKANQPFLYLEKDTKPFTATEVWNPKVDIGPMGKSGITSKLTLSICRYVDGHPMHVFAESKTDLALAPRLANSNTALWSDSGTDDPNVASLVESTLAGFVITPEPRFPAKVCDVPLIQLLFIEGNDAGFHYQKADVVPGYRITIDPSGKDELKFKVAGLHDETFTDTGYHLEALVKPWVAEQRRKVIDALVEGHFGTIPDSEIKLDVLAIDKRLTDWPMVRQLGA